LIASSGILGEITDAAAASDLSASGQSFASQYFAEGRFAGAISPDESNSITIVDTHGNAIY
jgi:hypothetical protein